MLGTMKKK